MPSKPLAWIVALAVALRLAAALYLGDAVEELPGIADQVSYHRLATRVLDGHGFSFDQPWWPLTRPDQPTAHWSFLYTLFLAGTYALFGVHPLAPRLAQAVLSGLLLPWLTLRLARRVWPGGPAPHRPRPGMGWTLAERAWGPGWAAWVSALWAAGYGYFVYYSAALMTETFYILGILWALDATLRLGDALAAPQAGSSTGPPPGWRGWLELGLAIGVAVHLRQVFLLFAPFLFLWLAGALWFRRSAAAPGRPWGKLIRGGLFSAGVVALLILPATVYNYRQFNRFVLLNTNAGFAFFWANHPIYGDRFLPLLEPDMPTYQELIPRELRRLDEAALESALMRQGLGFVLADPARYLRLSASRLPIYFQFWPSAASSTLSNIVRVGSFGVALPFMLLGLGLWGAGAGRGGLASPGGLLVLFGLVYSLVHLLSWALIRYRLPVDAVLLVFAGQAAAAILRRVGRRAAGLTWSFGLLMALLPMCSGNAAGPVLTPGQTATSAGPARIAFQSDRAGDYDIYVMNADGSGQTRLTSSARQDLDPAWSPDGAQIAFASTRDGNLEIYLLGLETEIQNVGDAGLVRLTDHPAADANPAWSPDGDKIAFVSNRTLNLDIFVISATRSDIAPINLTDHPANDQAPAWSPDGERLLFVSDRDGDNEIYSMRADGSGQANLSNSAASDTAPAWSPDGSQIAFVSLRDGNPEIYTMNADGSEQRRLTNNQTSDQSPAWSPDGAQIAFHSERDGAAEIYVMNADGSGVRRLTHDPAQDRYPAWQPQ